MKKFTKDHEWISLDGTIATVGITDHAQCLLGDVVFVELPTLGAHYAAGDQFAVVESVKAASDVYAPVAGTVTEVNSELEANPAQVNEGAETNGWFARFKLDDAAGLDGLMDQAAYDAFVAANS
jgi:glycine cleavage system H protein